MKLPGRSFAMKLTVLITTISGLAAALVCAGLVALEVKRVVHDSVQAVTAQARIIAANTTAALDFDDAEAARKTLAGLAAVPELTVAEIRKADGTAFARYERGGPDAERTRELTRRAKPNIKGRWLELSHPIVRDGDTIGTLTLLYDFAPARRRLLLAAAMAAAVTVTVIVLSYLAAKRLQRSLLAPVRELAQVAMRVADTENYDIRARKYSSDELGVLTDVFNGMLERIGEAESVRRDYQAMLERDVQRRTAEVVEAQSRLRQSERMASLGTLSAGLGHDIGNILMPLRAHISAIRELAGRGKGGDARAEEHFAAVARATEYLQNLSAGLRMMAQDPDAAASPHERVRLAEWWTVTEPLLHAVVGRGVKLEHDLPDSLPRVKMARHLLTQVVLNLVQNAATALLREDAGRTAGGVIRVCADQVEDGPAGPRVRLSVIDNGPGMDEEVRRRCLEPYFTTGPRRISSGMGLAIVKGIVERVGGTVQLFSEPGQGATLTLVLPAEHETVADQVRAVVTLSEPRKRAIVTHLLATLNCRVESVTAGDASLDGGSRRGVWVTDSVEEVPEQWGGRIVLLGEAPAKAAGTSDRIVVLDPSLPVPALRGALERVCAGGR